MTPRFLGGLVAFAAGGLLVAFLLRGEGPGAPSSRRSPDTGGDRAQAAQAPPGGPGSLDATESSGGSAALDPAKQAKARAVVVASPPAGAEAAGDALASLGLRVVDRTRGEALASAVQLWRLPPGGDPHLVREVDVPEEGLVLDDLKPGTYRAHVRRRLRASEDPPAFDLQAPRTDVRLEVETATTYAVRLEIRNELGHVVRLGRASQGYSRVPAFEPDFSSEAGGTTPGHDLGGFDFGSRHLSVETEDSRFLFGQARDLDCTESGNPWYRLLPKGRTPVRVELEGHELFSSDSYREPEEQLVLLGVSVPEGWFDDAIRLPDGRRAVAVGAEIDVTCTARVQDGARDVGDAWRHVPLRVTVRLKGYAPLDFEYRLVEGQPEPRTLARETG